MLGDTPTIQCQKGIRHKISPTGQDLVIARVRSTEELTSDKFKRRYETGTWKELNETGCNVFKPSDSVDTGLVLNLFDRACGHRYAAALNGVPDF